MVQVCERAKTKADMLAESIGQYKEMYLRARGEFEKVLSVSHIFTFSLTLTYVGVGRVYVGVLREVMLRVVVAAVAVAAAGVRELDVVRREVDRVRVEV
jgi:hypothetical protein